ncbi:hypothetical protein [Rhizobium multihospitium]|uniref:hypothetical protein n=1 Tax=Rhizobium multihospitium TaxID=410764 RepID=UPI000B80ADEB|nr:hypothetical protein [Rhizobium multihospitium]
MFSTRRGVSLRSILIARLIVFQQKETLAKHICCVERLTRSILLFMAISAFAMNSSMIPAACERGPSTRQLWIAGTDTVKSSDLCDFRMPWPAEKFGSLRMERCIFMLTPAAFASSIGKQAGDRKRKFR